MKKITVIGNAAGGKTTLSRRLAEILHIQPYHLDQLFLRPDGTICTEDERIKIQDDIIKTPSWIIEGVGSLPSIVLRLLASDTIVIIDHPIWRLYYLGIKRFFKYLFDPDMKDVTLSSIFPALKKLVVMPWQLHRHFMPQMFHTIERVKQEDQTIIVLQSFKEINNFVDTVTVQAEAG